MPYDDLVYFCRFEWALSALVLFLERIYLVEKRKSYRWALSCVLRNGYRAWEIFTDFPNGIG